MIYFESFKERCSDCPCLVEQDGKWFCDEQQKPCEDIPTCNEWEEENVIGTGVDVDKLLKIKISEIAEKLEEVYQIELNDLSYTDESDLERTTDELAFVIKQILKHAMELKGE